MSEVVLSFIVDYPVNSLFLSIDSFCICFCRDVSTDSDQLLLSQDIDSAMEKYLSHSASGGGSGGQSQGKISLIHDNFKVEESEWRDLMQSL